MTVAAQRHQVLHGVDNVVWAQLGNRGAVVDLDITIAKLAVNADKVKVARLTPKPVIIDAGGPINRTALISVDLDPHLSTLR